MTPEFNIGDVVTYWPERKGMSTVVLDVFIAADRVIYRLIEASEGKPLKDHCTVLTEPVNILESRHYVRKRTPASLCGIGDPMSELNIQRRLQWWHECNPAGIIRVSQEMANKDPAVRRALEELDYVQLERPRKRQRVIDF